MKDGGENGEQWWSQGTKNDQVVPMMYAMCVCVYMCVSKGHFKDTNLIKMNKNMKINVLFKKCLPLSTLHLDCPLCIMRSWFGTSSAHIITYILLVFYARIFGL